MCRLQRVFEEGTRMRNDSRTAIQYRFYLLDVHLCWSYLEDHQIPLTNTFSERAIRPYVNWGKLSSSNQSEVGDKFRPMILSVIQTLRMQGVQPTAYCVSRVASICMKERLVHV